MLEIDYDLFITNLQKTQAYCQLQMNNWEADDTIIDNASVFRSFNPVINGKKLFEFSLKDLKDTINPVQKLVMVPTWTTSLCHLNDSDLLRDLQAHKDKCLEKVPLQTKHAGDVIAMQIDVSASDDTAPVSFYLFDEDGVPPLDTWFYFSPGEDGYRVLFAWMPEKYREFVDYAIAFDDLGSIDWFRSMYYDEYTMFKKKLSQFTLKNES